MKVIHSADHKQVYKPRTGQTEQTSSPNAIPVHLKEIILSQRAQKKMLLCFLCQILIRDHVMNRVNMRDDSRSGLYAGLSSNTDHYFGLNSVIQCSYEA